MSSDIIQMFCHIEMNCAILYRRVILLSFILLCVEPFDTYLNYDEDVDITFSRVLLHVYLIGINWVLIIYHLSLF